MHEQLPAYPIPRPANGDDTRFSYGLGLDVAAVLHRHGFPQVTTGPDLSRVLRALFTLIYDQEATR
jgi:hypothetical protein